MVSRAKIYRFSKQGNNLAEDLVVLEEPLQIILILLVGGHWEERSLSLTMRTPGHDLELVLGFLFAEGIIKRYEEVKKIWHCQQSEYPENTVKVQLVEGIEADFEKLQRYFLSHSGCGVCGKNRIEDLEKEICNPLNVNNKSLSSSIINSFNEILLSQQLTFRHTGGLHAAALFTLSGELQLVREDIGRHNCLDKVLGAMLSQGLIPLSNHTLFLSSRISYELVQKALMAGIPILAAVGAPSSLAISLAERYGLTLIGFVREERFNVYCHPERIG